MPKLSVIVPIYGTEKYIRRCVESLFNQTLDDIEFLFINDCTKDRSIEILHELLDEYPHRANCSRIINMKENSGLPSVRMHGIKLATGDYVIHCDSDDWVDCRMYEIMYTRAVREDLDLVWCDYYRSDGKNHKYISLLVQPYLIQGPVWNRMVKRSVYTSNHIEYPIYNKAEDGALMTQISFYANKRGHINMPLYYYYINPNSICMQSSEEKCLKKLEEEIANTELRIRFLSINGKLIEYKDDIIMWKLAARKNLLPLLKMKKYRILWRNIYPEINSEIICNLKIPLRTKLGFIVGYLGLYRYIANK